MISHPAALLLTLFSIVAFILKISKTESGKSLFKYLPIPLWCYFIPTVLSTVGGIPNRSELYSHMSRMILPACLILLLIGTDLHAIFRLGRKALAAMLAGTIGILVGGIALYPFLAGRVPELWKGWGSLAASWNGGSINMIAVKEILQTPDSLFSSLIIVDTVIAYSWMAFLVFVSKYQGPINRALKAETVSIDLSPAREPEKHSPGSSKPEKSFIGKYLKTGLLLIFAFVAGFLFWKLSEFLPKAGGILSQFTWTIILATVFPLVLSATRTKHLEHSGAETSGKFLLLTLLTSIGARADLAALISAPFLILTGFLWVSIHGTFLVFMGRLLKIPISLLAVASQANIGGAVSAPIVASIYDKNTVPVSLIMAVLGGLYGTATGFLLANICGWMENLL